MQWQFRMSWALVADFHLSRLTDELCMWMPHESASTVRLQDDGTWRSDWTEPEEGQPWHASAAWLTWHLQLWLTQALAEAGRQQVPTSDDVRWPGTANGVRAELERLAGEWRNVLLEVSPSDLERPTTFPWPDPRPLHRLISWANMEMMKNAAEIGVVVNSAILATRNGTNIA